MSAVAPSYYRIDPAKMKAARHDAMLTQAELSEVSGVSYNSIQRIEQGGKRTPLGQRASTVKCLAKALAIGPVDILWTDSPQGQSVGKPPGRASVNRASITVENATTAQLSHALADTKAFDLGVDLGSDLGASQPSEPQTKSKAQSRAIARSADPDEAAGIRRQLRARLTERGVTSLPRDWHLKVDAVISRWLRDGASPGEIGDALEWGLTHAWFSDKLHDPGKLIDLLPQYQQRGNSNGKPSPHRLDQHMARLRGVPGGR